MTKHLAGVAVVYLILTEVIELGASGCLVVPRHIRSSLVILAIHSFYY
jgi:hypothetical protein